VAGRALLFPSEGDLFLTVLDGRGVQLVGFPFAVQGVPGRSVDFFVEFDLPDQRGNLVTIEIRDVNARGDLLARVQSNVFAGSSPYPAP
jgi:hypothetical protein